MITRGRSCTCFFIFDTCAMLNTMNDVASCPLCGASEVILEPTGRYRYGHCSQCLGIFMDRRDLLDPHAEKSQYLTHNNDVNDPRYRAFVRSFVEVIAASEPEGVHGLDYGAGTGPVVAVMLEELGYHVSLWDPYFHAAEDVLKERYDFLFACEVIEHFYDPAESFRHMKSLLTDRGTLYCRTQLIPGDRPFGSWGYRNEETHVFFYHETTIAWIAQHILNCTYTIHDGAIISFSYR